MIGAMDTTPPAAPPKVFVSHASEDKARFVARFAARLRENGVDAWLDQWEMKPGDSLVDRIFEQGLKSAQAVIIVLSAVSVTKPWVREELNNSVVSRINRGLKIIPVVIDQCENPGGAGCHRCGSGWMTSSITTMRSSEYWMPFSIGRRNRRSGAHPSD